MIKIIPEDFYVVLYYFTQLFTSVSQAFFSERTKLYGKHP